MKNALTQLVLFGVATLSLYVIIQIAYLAVTQPRGVAVGDLLHGTAYGYLPTAATAMNLPVGLLVTQVVATQPPVDPAPTGMAPSLTLSLTSLSPTPLSPTPLSPTPLSPTPLSPTPIIVPTATLTPVPLLKLTGADGAGCDWRLCCQLH